MQQREFTGHVNIIQINDFTVQECPVFRDVPIVQIDDMFGHNIPSKLLNSTDFQNHHTTKAAYPHLQQDSGFISFHVYLHIFVSLLDF
jgi:hypothetical protein